MALPENPKAERRKIERWVVVASLAGVLLLAFAVLLAQPLRMRIIEYRFRSNDTDVRADAAAALLEHGVRGRLTLLGAIRSGRLTAIDWESSLLATALEHDMEAGRDCEPVMAAALEGTADKGAIGTRCARIAWAMRDLYAEGSNIRIAIAERCLYWAPELRLENGPAVQEEAADELARTGVMGQLLLLKAVCSTDVSVADNAARYLQSTLAKALADGEDDVIPVLRALLARVEQQDDAGRRCASIASEAWGLLSSTERVAVLRQCVALQVECHSGYPSGVCWPRLTVRVREISENAGLMSAAWLITDVKGRAVEGAAGVLEQGDHSFTVALNDLPAGGHTISARLLVQSPDGWSIDLYAEKLSLLILNEVPKDFLQVQATPDTEASLEGIFEASMRTFGPDPEPFKNQRLMQELETDPNCRKLPFHGRQASILIGTSLDLTLTCELPFDLAFTVQWKVKQGEREEYEFEHTYGGAAGGFLTLLRGETGIRLQVPQAMVDAMLAESTREMRHGRDRLGSYIVQATLVPSLEAALREPKVTAYWPKPIVLPLAYPNLKVPQRQPDQRLSAEELAARIRELRGPDVVTKFFAAQEMAKAGGDAWPALLDAMVSGDEPTSRQACEALDSIMCSKDRLCHSMDRDASGQVELQPFVYKFIEGLNLPGIAGHRCAILLTDASRMDLLNEKTQRAILRRSVHVDRPVRPVYPPEAKMGLFAQASHMPMIEGINCQVSAIIDGQRKTTLLIYANRSWHVSPTVSLAGIPPGRHVLGTHVKMVGVSAYFPEVNGGEIKEEYDLEPVPFTIAEKPDLHLEAKVNAETARLIADSVRLDMSRVVWRGERDPGDYTVIEPDLSSAELVLERPLPVDLAFHPRWTIAGKNKSYPDLGCVMRRGETPTFELHSSWNLCDALKELDGSITIRLTLEPWPEGAIEDGAVTAYWPEPITLPDISVTIRREKAAAE